MYDNREELERAADASIELACQWIGASGVLFLVALGLIKVL